MIERMLTAVSFGTASKYVHMRGVLLNPSGLFQGKPELWESTCGWVLVPLSTNADEVTCPECQEKIADKVAQALRK